MKNFLYIFLSVLFFTNCNRSKEVTFDEASLDDEIYSAIPWSLQKNYFNIDTIFFKSTLHKVDSLLDINPNHERLLSTKSNIYFFLGMYDRNLEFLDSLLIINKIIPKIYFNKCCLIEIIHDKNTAINQMELYAKEGYLDTLSRIKFFTVKESKKEALKFIERNSFDLRKSDLSEIEYYNNGGILEFNNYLLSGEYISYVYLPDEIDKSQIDKKLEAFNINILRYSVKSFFNRAHENYELSNKSSEGHVLTVKKKYNQKLLQIFDNSELLNLKSVQQ